MHFNFKISKNRTFFSILGVLILLKFSTPVLADDFKNYDENVVRAFKTAKIAVLSPDLSFPADASDEDINQNIYNYLVKTNYLKNNKQEIFFIKTEKVNKSVKTDTCKTIKKEFIVVSRLYNLKNPEKFMFALDRNKSAQFLSDREQISDTLTNDISEYAIISRKINIKNQTLTWKLTKAGYNGFLNIIILTPKLGFGYIINPPFKWIKTNKPTNIYDSISSEIEKISTHQKQLLKIKCFKREISKT